MPTPVSNELHLRRLTVEEALYRLDAYLDAALMAGHTTVRIIHGKGTGQLKAKVIATLQKHPLVIGHRPAGHGGGNWGATLVDLRLDSD